MDRIQPNLFIDFALSDSSLYLHFVNHSHAEAFQVTTKFSQPILALNGTKDLTKINLFRKLTYFAPHKEFKLYIDEVSRFLSTLPEKKTTIDIAIRYRNEEEKLFKKEITHDLAIYQDLPFLIKS